MVTKKETYPSFIVNQRKQIVDGDNSFIKGRIDHMFQILDHLLVSDHIVLNVALKLFNSPFLVADNESVEVTVKLNLLLDSLLLQYVPALFAGQAHLICYLITIVTFTIFGQVQG